mgnify:CR=1 FL=1
MTRAEKEYREWHDLNLDVAHRSDAAYLAGFKRRGELDAEVAWNQTAGLVLYDEIRKLDE